MKTCNPEKLTGTKPYGVYFDNNEKKHKVKIFSRKVHGVLCSRDENGNLSIGVNFRRDYPFIPLSEIFYTKASAEREAKRRNKEDKEAGTYK